MATMRPLFLVASFFVSWACVQTVASNTTILEKSYNVFDFDRIIADGYFKLEIIQQPITNAYLTTSTYLDNPIEISVHDRTLYLIAKYNYRPDAPQPNVCIRLDHLNSLAVYGPTTVYAESWSTPGLVVDAEGYGRIDLKNVGAISTIKQRGNNLLSIMGIKTSRLDLNMSGFGKTILQGTAEQLYVELHDTATLKAKDLVATAISIQAKNQAEAYIHPTQSLKAFTDESSTIYYYQQPQDMTTHPMASGNVLPLQDIPHS